MKKKYLLLGVTAILVATAIIGGSLAAINAVGEEAINNLGAPTLEVGIDSVSSVEAKISDGTENFMPGSEVDCSGYIVENTAEVPLYARVTVTKYWSNEENEKNKDLDAKLIEMSVDESGWLQANEVMMGNSGETVVYYLATPLAPGESASLPLKVSISAELGNEGQGNGIMMKAEVDAVQYVEGQPELNANGILASFGVLAELGNDGSIISVTQ